MILIWSWLRGFPWGCWDEGMTRRRLRIRCPEIGRSSSPSTVILGVVYQLSVQTSFSAAHALMLAGTREQVHGHDWHLTVIVEGATLDEDGLLCDFHALEALVERIVAPFRNADLNASEAFSNRNPSAENVVEFIGRSLIPELADRIRLARISVTEAPGCVAHWIPDEVDWRMAP